MTKNDDRAQRTDGVHKAKLEEEPRVERDDLALERAPRFLLELLLREPLGGLEAREVVDTVVAGAGHNVGQLGSPQNACMRRVKHSRAEFAQEVHLRAASGGSLEDRELRRLRGGAREGVYDDVGSCECRVQRLVVVELHELGALGRERLGLLGGGVAGEDADTREGGAELGHESVANECAYSCTVQRPVKRGPQTRSESALTEEASSADDGDAGKRHFV